jgi:hypothetical protein
MMYLKRRPYRWVKQHNMIPFISLNTISCTVISFRYATMLFKIQISVHLKKGQKIQDILN